MLLNVVGEMNYVRFKVCGYTVPRLHPGPTQMEKKKSLRRPKHSIIEVVEPEEEG
jgi:hypothetical protein